MAEAPFKGKYTPADVTSAVAAVAAAWKRKPADAGVDAAKAFESLKAMTDEWRNAGSGADKDLQALLALATASAWFSKEQNKEIDALLAEVAGCCEEEDEWLPRFPEDAVREAVNEGLWPETIEDINIDTIAKAVAVEYTKGDYGQGKHDGTLHLSDDGLKIYDKRNPGYALIWDGELPWDPDALSQCLQSAGWYKEWEGEY